MIESRNSTSKNVIDGFATKIVLVALKLAVLVLTAKLYGADGRGVFITTLTLVGLCINLSNFGLGDALLQRFAKRGKCAQDYSIFLTGSILISSVIGILILQISLYFQNTEQLDQANILIMHLLIPTAAVELLVSLSLRGLGFHHYVNRLSLLSRALLVVFLTLALFLEVNVLNHFLFWYLIVSNLTAVTTIYLFFKIYKPNPSLSGFIIKCKILFSRGLSIYPINLLMEFENRFDVLLLIYLSDPVSLGAYVTGVSFAQTGFYASNALTAILTTNFGGKAGINAAELAIKAQRYAIASVIMIGTVTALFAGVIVFGILGHEFYSSIPIMLILSVGVVADASTRVIASWSKGQLVSHKFIKPSIFTLFLNFAVCLALLKVCGIFGLAVGSSFGYILRSLFYLRVFRRQTNNYDSIVPNVRVFHDITDKVMKISWNYFKSQRKSA